MRSLLVGACRTHGGPAAEAPRRFEFHRFDVTLDLVNDVAVIEEVSRPGAGSGQRMRIGELVHSLARDEDFARPVLRPAPSSWY